MRALLLISGSDVMDQSSPLHFIQAQTCHLLLFSLANLPLYDDSVLKRLLKTWYWKNFWPSWKIVNHLVAIWNDETETQVGTCKVTVTGRHQNYICFTVGPFLMAGISSILQKIIKKEIFSFVWDIWRTFNNTFFDMTFCSGFITFTDNTIWLDRR